MSKSNFLVKMFIIILLLHIRTCSVLLAWKGIKMTKWQISASRFLQFKVFTRGYFLKWL